jgi:hypothetical protein
MLMKTMLPQKTRSRMKRTGTRLSRLKLTRLSKMSRQKLTRLSKMSGMQKQRADQLLLEQQQADYEKWSLGSQMKVEMLGL